MLLRTLKDWRLCLLIRSVFALNRRHIDDLEALNRLNSQLLENMNATGKLYMTHTKLNGIYTIRIVIGQTYVEKRHMETAWELLNNEMEKIL